MSIEHYQRNFEGFDVCSFVLYLVQLHSRSSNHGYWFCLAMVLLIIVLVINYYEINKEL
jgi:hypothetical protein